MNGFNWEGIRYFVAAAQAGSLTAAARLLGSNQPTVGRHIDALEGALGVKLFQRTVKGLTPTDEGIALLEQCRVIEAQMVRIERTISGEGHVSGTVRLALPEGLCLEVVIPQLRRLYTEYPQLRLLLNVSSSTANLTRGEADLAVRLYRPTESNLVARQLGEMPLGLFASQDYIDINGLPTTPAELGRHRLIAYGESLDSLPENRWLLQHAGATVPVLCSDSTSSRLRATLAGVGIAIHPHLFRRSNPNLVPVLQEVVLSGHELWLVYHKDLRGIGRVRVVADFLTSLLGG